METLITERLILREIIPEAVNYLIEYGFKYKFQKVKN